MEYVWKPRKTVEISSLVRHRANVSNDLYVAKEENEKYMRTCIDEIESLSLELINALAKLQEHIQTWEKSDVRPTKISADIYFYTYWIQTIGADYTVDIDGNPKIKKWVEKYAKLQMIIDKLRYRIHTKSNIVKKSYKIQHKFIKPIISVCEPDEIFLEPISGTITTKQFAALKAEMQTISRNHIQSAILLLMSSNDIVRIFLKKGLTLIDFVDEVKTCIEREEPFGNIASSDSINNRNVIEECINTIKRKYRINETTSNPSIRINQQENMENVDAMFAEFNTLINQPHLLMHESGHLFGEGIFGRERLAYIADAVKTEKQPETIIPVLAEISNAQANANPYANGHSRYSFHEQEKKGHSRYSFYEFAPDVTDDNDNEFLTGIIVLTANASLSLSQAGFFIPEGQHVKQQLYDGFIYARDTLSSLCSSVGNTCGSYITSVSNVMMKLFSSVPEGGGAAAPIDVSQPPHSGAAAAADPRAGIGFRARKMNIEGKINARRSYERAIPSASTNTFQNMMPSSRTSASASTSTLEEIDTRPEPIISAPIRQPNIAENTEKTRMEDLARAMQIDRELQSRRGKTYPTVWKKEKLDGGKSTRKLISKNRKYSRRK
jgi:hypothetical protein